MLPEEIEIMTQELASSLCSSLKDYPIQIAFIFDRIYLRHNNLAPERQFDIVRKECGDKAANQAKALHAEYMSLDDIGDRRNMRAEAKEFFKSEFTKLNLNFIDYYYTSSNNMIQGVSFDAIVGDLKSISGNASNSSVSICASIRMTPSYNATSSSARTYPSAPSTQRITSITTYPPNVTIDGIQINLREYLQSQGITHVTRIQADNQWENISIDGIMHISDNILSFVQQQNSNTSTKSKSFI